MIFSKEMFACLFYDALIDSSSPEDNFNMMVVMLVNKEIIDISNVEVRDNDLYMAYRTTFYDIIKLVTSVTGTYPQFHIVI